MLFPFNAIHAIFLFLSRQSFANCWKEFGAVCVRFFFDLKLFMFDFELKQKKTCSKVWDEIFLCLTKCRENSSRKNPRMENFSINERNEEKKFLTPNRLPYTLKMYSTNFSIYRLNLEKIFFHIHFNLFFFIIKIHKPISFKSNVSFCFVCKCSMCVIFPGQELLCWLPMSISSRRVIRWFPIRFFHVYFFAFPHRTQTLIFSPSIFLLSD